MKRRITISSIANLFIPERKGQSVGRWPRMFTLVVGLSALVMLVVAAVAFRTTAAAEPAIVVTPPNLVTTPCWAAANETALDRNYGTFAGCWQNLVTAANPDLAELDRDDDTFADLRIDYVDHEVAADPDQTALDRNYGTFISVWWADFADR